jgi:peroxiredoxin
VLGPAARRLVLGALACAAFAAPARAEPPVDGPWIGISYGAGSEGLIVLEVHDDTAASDAGLERGDEIVELAGVPVFPGTDLPSLIARTRVGDRLTLAVKRGGARLAMAAVLGARPSDGELLHRRLVDKTAPLLDVELAAGGQPALLAARRGRPTVLAFFSTRCEGCAATLNQLGEMVARRAPRSQVVAVTADGNQAVAVYLQRSPVTVPVAHDDSGETWRRYTVPTAAPSLIVVIVDGRGTVRHAAVIAPGDDAALAELGLAAARIDRGRPRTR